MAHLKDKRDTLFGGVAGRIYAAENFPDILRDDKVLEIRDRLPADAKRKGDTQYDLLVHAARSAVMDRYIGEFMEREPEGVIAVAGGGLETAFYRNDDGKTIWYEVDLPEVLDYRRRLVGEDERDILLEADPMDPSWMERIRDERGDVPVLAAAPGIFYYYPKTKVEELLAALGGFGRVEAVFDAVNSSEMGRIAKVLKAAGYEDEDIYFHVDDPSELAEKTGGRVADDEALFESIPRKGLRMTTSMSMKVSDRCMMSRVIHLDLG